MSKTSAYAQAGVDIAAGQRATALMKSAVKATYGPEVLVGIGAFGGLYSAESLQALQAPILVASTDGVGTKTKVAAQLGRWDTIGHDIVNHCVNDILVQGARPLFFLDYVASAKLDPEQIAAVVGGVAEACQQNGCALLGGETAEMPGVYHDGALDLVGTVVGIVDHPHLIDGSRILVGDAIVALPSSGPHTNGYTLLRHLLQDIDWNDLLDDGTPIHEAILAPHRSYLREIQALLSTGVDIHGLAHITGGGIVDNLPRIFSEGIGAVIERGTWPELPIFQLFEKLGVDSAELFHVFNMGVGMLIVVPRDQVELIQSTVEAAYLVGEIVAGEGVKINA